MMKQSMDISDTQLNELIYNFNIVDKDKSGQINKQEFSQVIKNLNQNFNDQEIDKFFQDADDDGSGQINFPEFIQLMTKKLKQLEIKTELINLFKIFDEEKSGYVKIEQFYQTMKYLPKNSSDDFAILVSQHISENNGKFNYYKFVDKFTQI